MFDKPDNYETIEEQEARLGYAALDEAPLFPELLFRWIAKKICDPSAAINFAIILHFSHAQMEGL